MTVAWFYEGQLHLHHALSQSSKLYSARLTCFLAISQDRSQKYHPNRPPKSCLDQIHDSSRCVERQPSRSEATVLDNYTLMLMMFQWRQRLIFVEPGRRWAHSPSPSKAPGIPY